jgi:hypothetical protein
VRPSSPNVASVALGPIAAVAARNTGGFVVSVAPIGETDLRAQVLVRFSADVIPLERLESPAEAAILAHLSLGPTLPGRFRMLTPRMAAIDITGLPGARGDPAIRGLQPKISVQSSVALDASSLGRNALPRKHGGPASEITLAIALARRPSPDRSRPTHAARVPRREFGSAEFALHER